MNTAVRSIRTLLGWLAGGGQLHDEDLTQLDLDADTRRSIEQRIREAAEQITVHRRDGMNEMARRVARDTANEIAGLLTAGTDPAPTRTEIDALIAGVYRP